MKFVSKIMIFIVLEVVSCKDLMNFKNQKFLLKNIKPDLSVLANIQKTDMHENLDNFLSYWNVIDDNSNFETTKDPYTIFIPKLDANHKVPKENLQQFLLEHLVPGAAFKSLNDHDQHGNLNHNKIQFSKTSVAGQTSWFVNNRKIIKLEVISPNLSLIFIDGHLGDPKLVIKLLHDNHGVDKDNNDDDDVIVAASSTGGNNKKSPIKTADDKKLDLTRKTATTVENRRGRVGSGGGGEYKRDNDDGNINVDDVDGDGGGDEEIMMRKKFIKNLIEFLSDKKLGTKVFQHFLNKSNLSDRFDENQKYMILIPIDNAFQRWHPIDWGFYPFSVQEFTENVLRNHFVKMDKPLKLIDIVNSNHEINVTTMGGEHVVFRSHPNPSVNNVSILSEYEYPNGNQIMTVSEVLFVSEAIVSKLHQMHKDKETPPLLAFPWFGAQFLSHSFLALEKDSRFTQITRFLNTAEIAQFVSGSNYTFFVPVDSAFEKLGLNRLSDDAISTEKVSKMLLNHFIRGRLYDRDLKNDEVFESLGGEYLKIRRSINSNVTINNAHIIESEIFVYNLGTMFVIDEILYSNVLTDKYVASTKSPITQRHADNNGAPPPSSSSSSVPSSHPTTTSTATNRDGDDDHRTRKGTEVYGMREHNDDILIDGNDDDEDDDDEIETETPKALPSKLLEKSEK